MNKLDWYIVKKFLGTFFFTLALILLIVIVFDISEKIDDFLESEVTIKSIIIDYYLNFIPYFGNLFSPLFIFISVIFFTSKMANDTEIIAILNSGMSFRRLLKPFMISAVVLGVLSFVLGNFIKGFSKRLKLIPLLSMAIISVSFAILEVKKITEIKIKSGLNRLPK